MLGKIKSPKVVVTLQLHCYNTSVTEMEDIKSYNYAQ